MKTNINELIEITEEKKIVSVYFPKWEVMPFVFLFLWEKKNNSTYSIWLDFSTQYGRFFKEGLVCAYFGMCNMWTYWKNVGLLFKKMLNV